MSTVILNLKAVPTYAIGLMIHAVDAVAADGVHRLTSVVLLSLAMRDSAAPLRLLCIALILAGVIGLKLVAR
jgi:quaternary ammonium compound-resistance protein SugE